MATVEETRAAEYRRQENARARWRCENARLLAGDPAAFRALEINWRPWRQRGWGWDPDEVDACQT